MSQRNEENTSESPPFMHHQRGKNEAQNHSYLFLLIHFEQFGNRSGLKSASELIRF